jgi:cellulose synthase/poly-beta-1,6-N-acetylglucosamine synthase-like glycosyltransferase
MVFAAQIDRRGKSAGQPLNEGRYVTSSPDLSIIIPVYNEGLNIEKTLQSLKASVPVPHEVLIVYDRDDDSTLPAVRPPMETYGNLVLLKNADVSAQ